MWFKVDDDFHAHPKVIGLPLAARGLWVTAGAWCGRYLTDGHVPAAVLPQLGATKREANQLVKTGLWAEVDGGYQFHEWHQFQPTKAEVLAGRESAKARRQQGKTRK